MWRSIVEHIDQDGHQDEWTSTADLDRSMLMKHPWTLNGGGAVGLVELISRNSRPLRDDARSIGYTGQTNADDVFLHTRDVVIRHRIPDADYRAFLTGDDVRDWLTRESLIAVFPYDSQGKLLPISEIPELAMWMWPYRTSLWGRATFAQTTYREEGKAWWAWHQVAKTRLSGPVLSWPLVQTHNHFAFLHEAKLHNRHALVVQLPEGATEDDHLALLGVLNSSTACFWLKQNSHGKGNGGVNEGFRGDDWEEFYEFTGTTLKDYPLPAALPLERGRLLDSLATDSTHRVPATVVGVDTPTRTALDAARRLHSSLRARMITQQEELDWEVYRLYGLVEDDLTYPGDDPPEIAPGERAFEIALARRIDSGEGQTAWFERNGSITITKIPQHWPAAYRHLVQRRLDLIESDPSIRLLERPEYKRRWASEPWEKQEERALRVWLLDRLEDKRFWFDAHGRPTPRSIAQLADDVARDRELAGVLALWEGRPDLTVTASLTRLLADEAVPFLAVYRYEESGLRKRADWEATWALQRREDVGEDVGSIPVPPKYTPKDFVKTSCWQARGKLDVPKERFIGYPNAGRETDPTPVIGWAGWDHAQQALALNLLIGQREQDGWDDERLVPLIAGLAELQPWIDQWHGDIDPTFGFSFAAFCREELTKRAQQVGRTFDQLAGWRAPQSAVRRGRRPRTAGAKS